MAGLMSNISRRNRRMNEALEGARSARTGRSATSKPGPKVGAKTRTNRGLRAQPARPARRMQTNLPVTRANRPRSISGDGSRQQRIQDIERRIKELGG